jgi:hypothetical protein
LPADSEHPHLVLCSVPSEERLLAAADYLFTHNVRFHLFREPDRADEATALATGPLSGDERRLMERFRCLSSGDLIAAPWQDDGQLPDRQTVP